VVPKLIFIWFNPLNTPIDVKRMYHATEIALEKTWNGIQVFRSFILSSLLSLTALSAFSNQ